MSRVRSFGALLLLGVSAPIVHAQTAVVRVLVSDSARAPLRDADVALLKNGSEPVIIGRTDAAGVYVMRFEPEKASYSVLARQIGFSPATRAVEPVVGDTVTVSLMLARGQQYALDTVRVTERE